MEKYIKNNKFPSYEYCMKRLEELIKNPNLDKVGKPLEEWCELGEDHYNLLKKIYDSGFDRKITEEAGEQINEIGGIIAMRYNFYSLMRFAPTRYSKKYRFSYQIVEKYWDGIGQWEK